MTYESPHSYVCVTLTNCTYWQPAAVISWRNLPTYKSAQFYESDTCHAGDGKFSFVSDQLHTDGSHLFQTPTPIRSMMVGGDMDYTRRPTSISVKCQLGKVIALAENTPMNGSNTELHDGNDTASSGVDDNPTHGNTGAILVRDASTSSTWFEGFNE